mmetsp:Transcript_53331/g.79672  ORF Transcript_53331/g.79672 Transcript_53331/m.79672 type:complete len:226 (-) Transcript_53331:245-922(-)
MSFPDASSLFEPPVACDSPFVLADIFAFDSLVPTWLLPSNFSDFSLPAFFLPPGGSFAPASLALAKASTASLIDSTPQSITALVGDAFPFLPSFPFSAPTGPPFASIGAWSLFGSPFPSLDLFPLASTAISPFLSSAPVAFGTAFGILCPSPEISPLTSLPKLSRVSSVPASTDECFGSPVLSLDFSFGLAAAGTCLSGTTAEELLLRLSLKASRFEQVTGAASD